MKKILLIALSLSIIFTACKKTDFDDTVTGEAVGNLTLLSPNADSIILNPATPNTVITFKWTPAAPGVNSTVKYRVIAKRKTAASFDAANRVFELPSNNNGLATELTITYKQLDDVIKTSLIGAAASRAELDWTVEAYNDKSGSTLASSSNLLILKRFAYGSTPFSILGPSSSTSTVTINPNATTTNMQFNWTKSMLSTNAPAIRYVVNFYKDDVTTTPLFKVESNNAGADSLLTISQKAFSDSLTKYGFTNKAEIAKLKWNVSATSGTWVLMSDFTNQFYVVREMNLFIVGGASPIGWNPTDALQFIEDASRPGVYYMYTLLKGGNGGFKLLGMKADWGAAGQTIYGEVNGANTSGNMGSNNTGELTSNNGGNNIAVPGADGVYRITVDLTNNKYYIQQAHGRMGIVGGGTAAGWNPSMVFPSQEMGYASTNLFVGITNVTSGGEFKMLDNSDWPNGSMTYTRDYEDAGNGKLAENGGDNFKWNNATGPVRVIWDYRDVKNPKYVVNAATEMRVVGNGMSGVNEWDPGSSPQMTYLGNGRWSITLNLISGKDIKFLAGNAWGAFDYEDASGGSNATGVARSIKWEGGDNFKTPNTSGSYTIVLDEYKQTVTFN